MMLKWIFSFVLVASVSCDVSHLFRQPLSNFGRNTFRPQPLSIRPQPPVRSQPLVRAQSSGSEATAQILRQDSDIGPDGSYQWAYDTQNGISAQEQGSVRVISKDESITSAQGSFQYTSPDGQAIQLSYIADENGFQPVGNHLPVPPPIPLAIQRAIDFNEGRSSNRPTYRQ